MRVPIGGDVDMYLHCPVEPGVQLLTREQYTKRMGLLQVQESSEMIIWPSEIIMIYVNSSRDLVGGTSTIRISLRSFGALMGEVRTSRHRTANLNALTPISVALATCTASISHTFRFWAFIPEIHCLFWYHVFFDISHVGQHYYRVAVTRRESQKRSPICKTNSLNLFSSWK